VAVIGLDGTPFTLLNKEIEAGTLPNLGKLASRGEFRQMESEIPTVSSVAWASFMTGCNPGEHGIYGFTDRKPGTYDFYFPNYDHLGVEPLWDRLSREGRRCCVLNVPSTYPAHQLNGILVSGFVAPNLERAVYPREAYEYLSASGYKIDVDASQARESLDLLVEELHSTLDKRREAMFHFWKQEDWDLFMCVFTGTDRLHHFMWKLFEDEDPTYAGEFREYYRRLDGVIGEFVEELPDDAALFMLSDHGFCGIEKEVYLNILLRNEGLLKFKDDKPQLVMDLDPATTKAYCLDPGRIYLNLEGREPGGIVSRGSYNEILREIKELLEGIKDPQGAQQIISRVVKREDCYFGSKLDMGPDLVAVPERGYDLKGSVISQEWIGRSHLEGMHTHDDAFVYVPDEWAAGAPRHIRELAPLLASVLGS
jgi:predicted AlkP superfamily phosphohydrolase/phosphomutase